MCNLVELYSISFDAVLTVVENVLMKALSQEMRLSFESVGN